MNLRRDYRNRASLFDSIEEGGILAPSYSSHEIDEYGNDRAVDGLQDRVNILKRLTGEIHEEVEIHNRALDRMGHDMDASRGVLSGTVDRFKMKVKSQNGYLCGIFPGFDMADNEKGQEETSSRGADWEVVSLTASAYAAAPGPSEFDPTDESKEKESITNHDTSAALFMSGHFIFPPSEHENLPIEPAISEIHSEPDGHDVSSEVFYDDNLLDNLGKQKLQTESDDDLHGIEFFDKENIGFQEGIGFQGLNSVGKGQGKFADSQSVAFQSGAHESGTKFETEGTSNTNTGTSQEHARPNEDKSDGSDLPSQSWWKRHAASMYDRAKEANTFWSVVVAAAFVGLVILGQQWQRDKLQLHKTKWRFSINDERMIRMLGPVGRFKHVLVGSHHPSKLAHGVGAASSI
ncbi:unnamed protein product [Musa banksii]